MTVYEIESDGCNGRGKPIGRCKGRVEEYLGEGDVNRRGILEQVRRECWDMERWRIFCSGQHL